jgi:3-isopropylmalate dehydratase small subunit
MAVTNGRVRYFGDNIDTDAIAPGPYLHLALEELILHAFEPITPDFYKTVENNDIIVAGNNFGCGSSREQATTVVKELGIQYVICESIARIYFRNCIALGLYPIIAEGVSTVFKEGDPIVIDRDSGRLTNPNTGDSVEFIPLTGATKKIIDAGGILAALKTLIHGQK